MDLEAFRIPKHLMHQFSEESAGKTPKRTVQQNTCFIRGPIPLGWLQPVLLMSGRTPLAVSLALHFQAGLTRNKTVRFTRRLRETFHLEQRAARRALKQLREAGLVKVERKPGCCVVVEILKQDED